MKLNELTNIEDIRSKAAAFNQQRQVNLNARSNRVMSPEQIARVRSQTIGAIPKKTPNEDWKLFTKAADRIIIKPGGHDILANKYKQIKNSNDPLDIKKRQYLFQLLTGNAGFRPGVSKGYRI